MRSIAQWLGKPFPLRFLILRSLDRRLHFLPYPTRLKYGTIERANYGYCLLHAAKLARQLGHVRISAIEFGVAGGNGLVALERHALSVTAETGVQVGRVLHYGSRSAQGAASVGTASAWTGRGDRWRVLPPRESTTDWIYFV